MTGVFIALLTTLSWSIGVFPFTEASKRLGVAVLNQYRLFLAWIIISILLMIFYQVSVTDLFSKPQINHYLFLGLSGIVGFTIGDYFTFSAFKMIGPKLGSLYFTFAPIAALLVGFIILDQKINLTGIVGILLTIAGVIWLTLSRKDKKASEEVGFKRNPLGIASGILGALCQGGGLVISKLGMDAYEEKLPTLHSVWIRLMFAFTAAFVVSVFAGRFRKNAQTVVRNKDNGLPYLFAGTFFGPVMGVSLSLLTIEYIEVAAAQTIFSLVPVVVLPINYFYYRERITPQAVFGCLIAVAGVFILIWRNTISQWL